MNEQLDPSIVALTKAIGHQESGGDYNKIGDNGHSKGAYQWNSSKPLQEGEIPENFRSYAQAVGANRDDFSPENQDRVAYKTVEKWGKEGLSPAQIASKWNSGQPDAYKTAKAGYNAEQGVNYDVGAYVNNVAKYYDQFRGEQNSQPNQEGYVTSNPLQASKQQTQQEQTQQPEGLVGKAVDVAKGVGNFLFPIVGDVYHDVKGDNQKTLLQQGGDLALSALPFIPGLGEFGTGLRGAAKAGALGYGAGVASNLSEGKSIPESVKLNANTIGGTVLGAAAPSVLKGVGKLTGAAERTAQKNLIKTVESIAPEIRPGTVAGAKDVLSKGTTKSGVGGLISRNTDPALQEMAQVVNDNIPKFNKLDTNSEKLNAIMDEAIPKEAEALRSSLRDSEIQPIVTKEIYNNFKKEISDAITNDPSLVGDSGQYAKRLLGVFEKNLPKGRDILMEDVLNARQALDTAAKTAKPKAFEKSDAFSQGLEAVRNAANNMLDRSAPNAKVKASLRRQSLLYRAAKNLAPKADREVGSTRVSRFVSKHPVLGMLGNKAIDTGLTGIGLGGAYGAYKGLFGE